MPISLAKVIMRFIRKCSATHARHCDDSFNA